MELTKQTILHLLATNDKAVGRALIVLYARQTNAEQMANATVEHNGRGFNGIHAEIGSSMARFYMTHGYLTSKQVAYWRKSTPKMGMRIGIYWRQLMEAAVDKSAQKTLDKPVIVLENDDSSRMSRLSAAVADEKFPAITLA